MSTNKLENKIPIWCKYTLTIEEAAAYFRIGETKMRYLVHDNPNAEYVLWNGNRAQIKRVLFEKVVDRMNAI
ncbi:excisionase [Anaerotignum sp.]